MGMLSWLGKEKHDDESSATEGFEEKPPLPARPGRPKDILEPDHHQTSDVSFDDIVEQFNLYSTQALTSQDQITTSLTKLQQTLAENTNLTTLVQQLRYQNQKLQGTIRGQGKHISDLERLNKQRKNVPKPESGQVPGLNGSGHKLYANLLAEHEKLQAYTLFISEKAQNMQFELELLKCTAAYEDTSSGMGGDYVGEMQLTPQPFVVVLIDGDAYAVSILLA